MPPDRGIAGDDLQRGAPARRIGSDAAFTVIYRQLESRRKLTVFVIDQPNGDHVSACRSTIASLLT